MISYVGIFFDDDEKIHCLEKNRLENVNDKIHVTFCYHPTNLEIFDKIVGNSIKVKLIGYGSDVNNSGFKVKFSNKYNKYYQNYDSNNKLKIPHITASLSKDGKASDTKNLIFHKINTVTLVGKFGYWIKDGNKEYVSFKQFSNN